MNYRHTAEMGEISGFAADGSMGGALYEKVCNDMLEAGVKWIMEHPDAELKMSGIRNVTGIFQMGTPAGEELEKVVAESSRGEPDATGKTHLECTGAQMHHVMMRLMFISEHGWDKYVEEVLKPYPDDADEPDDEPPAAA